MTRAGCFRDVADKTICWMSHTDYISQAPEGFRVTAHTPVCPVAAMENRERKHIRSAASSGGDAHGGGYEDARVHSSKMCADAAATGRWDLLWKIR